MKPQTRAFMFKPKASLTVDAMNDASTGHQIDAEQEHAAKSANH